jgi:hypothetical protein
MVDLSPNAPQSPDTAANCAAASQVPDLKALRDKAENVRATQWESIELELETITPIYGGGTEAGHVDWLLPFRPRAIKNSIRHWWWLLNRYNDVYFDKRVSPTLDGYHTERLYRDMVDIWGGASEIGDGDDAEDAADIPPGDGDSVAGADAGKRSRVRVEVEVLSHGNGTTQNRNEDLRTHFHWPYPAWEVVPEKIKISKNGEVQVQLTGKHVLRQNNQEPWMYALFGAKGEEFKPADKNRPTCAEEEQLRNKAMRLKAIATANPPVNHASALCDEKSNPVFKGEGEEVKRPAILAKPGIKWKLRVWIAKFAVQGPAAASPCATQVKQALAYWLAFDGVGARASRGLGRSRVTNSLFDPWRFIVAKDANGKPTLPKGALKLKFDKRDHTEDACSAMTRLLASYKEFRQLRNGQHRSHWPKADVARRQNLAGGTGAIHPVRLRGAETPLPELLFGAPIGVRFMRPIPGQGEDTECTFGHNLVLQGKPVECERYESPLRFGVRFVDQRWMGCALLLHWKRDVAVFEPSARVDPSGTTVRYGVWWPQVGSKTYDDDAKAALRWMNTTKPQAAAGGVVDAATNPGNPFDLFFERLK